VPAESALTPLGRQILGELPPFLRRDPDHMAVAHAYAKEVERAESKINVMRMQAVPTEATLLLKLWEITVNAEVEPPGITEPERQKIVAAFLRALVANPSGLNWEAVIRLLAGSGWLYIEHIKGDGGTPAPNVVHVVLPFGIASFWFGTISRLIERVTPAHIELIITATEGFLLDHSELDKDDL
jgi:hypothetical protein